MSGLTHKFKKELFRRESSINTLNEFLKYAKLEQDLHDVYGKELQSSPEPKPTYSSLNHTTTPSLAVTVKQPQQYYHQKKRINHYSHPNPTQSSAHKRNSTAQRGHRAPLMDEQIRNDMQQPPFRKKSINNLSTTRNQSNNCKVCGRSNHRTNDCFHKRATGCYNCGQNHNVRSCTLPPNFQ